MARPKRPIPYFTPIIFLYFLLLPSPTVAINITALLSSFPDLSDFSAMLSTSGVAADLTRCTSLTILAVPNSKLASFPDLASCSSLPDILRNQILLQYFSYDDLSQIPAAGKLVTTLYQTTGRASNNFGSVNITFNPVDATVSIQTPEQDSHSNSTILSLAKTVPYNVSVFRVNSLIVTCGFDLMASETRPPLGINITKALLDGHNFNVAVSMLMASGVVQELETDERGAGITLFIPTDEAFASIPTMGNLQSLPADKKAVILKFHVLHSYYPLGSLESIVNPVQPTLATEDMGAVSFTLNISRVNGSVTINTGIVQASIAQTVFDENPLAIFGVSQVLLPKEFFGKATNQTVDVWQAPENSPVIDDPLTLLSSPPEGMTTSGGGVDVLERFFLFFLQIFCIRLYLLL